MVWSKEFICEIQVAISSLCFGLSFVGQRVAATNDEADPMTYNSWRFFISVLTLVLIKEKLKASMKTNISHTADYEQEEIPFLNYLYRIAKQFSLNDETFHLYFWGILGGVLNFVVQACQQYGIQTVSAGKAALINGLFVVVAPFIESILPYFESNINLTSWCAIFLSGIGTYFLSSPESGGFGYGEFLLVMSMLGCCFVILISDVASKRVDCIDVTLIELTTVVIFSTGFSLWMHPEYWYWPLPALQHGLAMVVCVGLSEAIGYSLGTLGQMHIPSHRASVLYGLEGAFAVLFGYGFLGIIVSKILLILDIGETLSLQELFGCVLILAGTILGGSASQIETHDQVNGIEALPIYDMKKSSYNSKERKEMKYGAIVDH